MSRFDENTLAKTFAAIQPRDCPADRNPQDTSIHLILETLAETSARFLIIDDRIKKLALSLINEADPHGANRCSASLITSS